MAQKIQLRRDTAANWTAANPILAQGEVGYEIDTSKDKVGDGVTAWNSRPYTGVATAGWTQTGTGAVTRTVDGKLKDQKSSADYGATLNHSYSNSNRLVPRKLASKLLSNFNGTTTNLRVCVFGDSLAAEKPKYLNNWLARQLSGINTALRAFHGGAALAGGLGSTYEDLVFSIVTGTFTSNGGDGYTYWPTGPLNQLVSGSRVKWVFSGNPAVNPTFTSVTLFYVREPGAGSFEVLVNDAVVQTIDASNASVALGSYTYTQASAASKFEALTVSGSIRVVGVFNTTTAQGVQASRIGASGLSLASAMSSAQARGIFQSFLSTMNYDVFTWEMDDLTPSDLALLGNVLDGGIPVADKIFIASTPQVGIPTSSQRRDDLETFCLSRGVSYFFFDGWTPVAPYSTLTALGWQGDGVHPLTDCQSYLAGLLIRQLGIDAFVLGRDTRPVRTASSEPSQLGRGTLFKGGQPDGNLSFDTDATFSYDWTVNFSRTLTFTGGLGGSQVVAQFSRNTGANPNILPTSWKWDSSSDTRSLAWSAAGGYTILSFLDSANTVGASPIYASGLQFAAYTVATLPTSNNRYGTVILVSNGGSGGTPCLAYSRGEGPTTWRRVVDDTVI